MIGEKEIDLSIKDIVSVALFAALTAALGFVPALPVAGIPVPITVQLLGVMLAGALLGAKRGFLVIVVVWILVAIGLPVLSGGHGGFGSFFTPSAGYLFGWGFGAWVIGGLYHLFRNHLTPITEFIALFCGGIIVCHLLGIIWLSFAIQMPFLKALMGDLIFVPGDIIKIIITIWVTCAVRRGLPNAFD